MAAKTTGARKTQLGVRTASTGKVRKILAQNTKGN